MNCDNEIKSISAGKLDRNLGLGSVLQTLRKAARVTQAEVAVALGLDRTSVTNVESGTQTLTIEKLQAYAATIGAEVTIQFRPKRRGAITSHLLCACAEATTIVQAPTC